jgi:hypothetical protein
MRNDVRVNFANVCQVVESCGWKPSGEVDVVPKANFPFRYYSDLVATKVAQQHYLNPEVSNESQKLQGLIYGRVSDSWVSSVGYIHDLFGYIVVQYAAVFDIEIAPEHHPICVTFGGDLFSLPFEELSDQEKEIAAEMDGIILSVFQGVCEQGQVLYGAILSEETLPAPNMLAQYGVHPELFISKQLVNAKPSLDDALDQIFTGCARKELSCGTYWSCGTSWTGVGHSKQIAISKESKLQAGLLLSKAMQSFAK